ncbi:MAG: CHAT domain-containing protein [Candidatus Sericytochromatia bacterium]
MQSNFDLIISADALKMTADLQLMNSHGVQIAYKHTNFKQITASRLHGLFNLRDYIKHYVESGKEAESLAEIGMCIADEVLGKEIFGFLASSHSQRTLCVQLPSASEEQNILAAAISRIPWEIARPEANKPTLGEKNLLVRVIHEMNGSATEPLEMSEDEPLRILFVFAEAQGSHPLASRSERRALINLFEREIYPKRRVIAHFLTHGVTRERLESQIQEQGGYHIVHWSGHGHTNLLELAKSGGGKDYLSGQELLECFINSGGFIPRLFFLSACHSGNILNVKDWNDFLTVSQGQELGTKHSPIVDYKDISLEVQSGYTGTAHALIQGGVPSVVAMRFAVGDEYARDLGVAFYSALLAHSKLKNVSAALSMARQSLRKNADAIRYHVCDPATPVLYGIDDPGIILYQGHAPVINMHNRRLHQIAELTMSEHEHFVGRTWELSGLGAEFIGSRTGEKVKPIALITGLGGMGKTALTAEILDLWEDRFEQILLYQSKPNPIGLDNMLQDIHTKLNLELGRYHEHIKVRPADAIYRRPSTEFTGKERLERLIYNLIRAMQDEPILLVLDNFEANLKPQPDHSSIIPLWLCQDPAWDLCLTILCQKLMGTPSRILITSRMPLFALRGSNCYRISLGPLSTGEAALYLREQKTLKVMMYSAEEEERKLAIRLLNASRFHPLLMNQLAQLAGGGPVLRHQLIQAIEALENGKDYNHLPSLFSVEANDTKVLAYLQDALSTSLDLLIEESTSEARCVLWMIAIAFKPVNLGFLQTICSGQDTPKQANLRKIKEMQDSDGEELSEDVKEKLKVISSVTQQMIDDLKTPIPLMPDPTESLQQLCSISLISQAEMVQGEDSFYQCHELVRERIFKWMETHPQDLGSLNEKSLYLTYAEWLEFGFISNLHVDMQEAMNLAKYALIYFIQAGAFAHLNTFTLFITQADPLQLTEILPYLEKAVESLPQMGTRWPTLKLLAIALGRLGYYDESFSYFEQVNFEVRSEAEKLGEKATWIWGELATVLQNWAINLKLSGDFEGSRQRIAESEEAFKYANQKQFVEIEGVINDIGEPAFYAISQRLESLHTDIRQGLSHQTLPELENITTFLEALCKESLNDENVMMKPKQEILAGEYIKSLDIVREAYMTFQNWELSLMIADKILAFKTEIGRTQIDIAWSRLIRAQILTTLDRLDEAKIEFDFCLSVFDGSQSGEVYSGLAHLLHKSGDIEGAITQSRRALTVFEMDPKPRDRSLAHQNLYVYLIESGIPAYVVESSKHHIIALTYQLVSNLRMDLKTSLLHYITDFKRGHVTPSTLPRLTELVEDQTFHGLYEWLGQKQIPVSAAQAQVDNFLQRLWEEVQSEKNQLWIQILSGGRIDVSLILDDLLEVVLELKPSNWGQVSLSTNEESLKHYRDMINVVDTARMEGKAQGRAEGKAEGREEGLIEGKRQTAREMQADGMSANVISKYTGLSIEEIESLG